MALSKSCSDTDEATTQHSHHFFRSGHRQSSALRTNLLNFPAFSALDAQLDKCSYPSLTCLCRSYSVQCFILPETCTFSCIDVDVPVLDVQDLEYSINGIHFGFALLHSDVSVSELSLVVCLKSFRHSLTRRSQSRW